MPVRNNNFNLKRSQKKQTNLHELHHISAMIAYSQNIAV